MKKKHEKWCAEKHDFVSILIPSSRKPHQRNLNASLNLFHSFIHSFVCFGLSHLLYRAQRPKKQQQQKLSRNERIQFCGFFFSAVWWAEIVGKTSSRPNHLWFRLTLTVKLDHHQWTQCKKTMAERMRWEIITFRRDEMRWRCELELWTNPAMDDREGKRDENRTVLNIFFIELLARSN